ncbi:MAG: shikimate dehydrogenase [Bacteroidales bacterium]|nr:shikimate dehydrogenase [Bacteroidales bacterium]
MSKLFAVFGNPVLHSKSPQLFNSIFEKSHIDAYYTRIRVQKCEDVARTIRSLNIIGANITTPFKECIIPMLDSLSPEAEQIGAVNTILNDNGYLKGFNTDYLGVVKSIEEAGIDIFGKRCLVLGAGGASRAAVFGLMNSGAEVFIENRTQSKALEIANHLGCNVAQFNDIIDGVDIVVSTLLPHVALPDFNWNSGIKLFLDANYRKSNLSIEAQNAGINIIRGDRWLIHQAIASFSIFTGFEPLVELLSNSILQTLDFNHLSVKSIDLNDLIDFNDVRFDLLVSIDGLNPDEVKSIMDEEKYKASNG